MNENINLCEILKGHEGETFYSSFYGIVELLYVNKEFCKFLSSTMSFIINSNGKYDSNAELCVFPSKDQRNWNKWIKEQNSKVPKTWSELVLTNKAESYCVHTLNNTYLSSDNNKRIIEKSALALLKIHQLIEVGYGGNVSYERCSSIKYENVFKIAPCGNPKYNLVFDIIEIEGEHDMNHAMFHTREQAEEFIKYPENVQLLKDYFMIN